MDEPRQREVDALLKLADFWMQRVFHRMSFQWKVELAFWGVLAAATLTIKKRPENEQQFAVLLIAIFVGYVVFWLRELAYRQKTDRSKAIFYADQAAALLCNKTIKLRPADEGTWRYFGFGFLSDFFALFELLATVLFLYLAWLYLGRLGG